MEHFSNSPQATEALEGEYVNFFQRDLPGNPLKGEFFLPFAVDAMVQDGRAQVHVLETASKWYGVTYREDKPTVEAAIAEKTASGLYPDRLWEAE